MESITLFGVDFLPHTWPLVFGVPGLLVASGILGILYEILTTKRGDTLHDDY